jgi:pimeloyl-ACP methyl ester carboxylesterase
MTAPVVFLHGLTFDHRMWGPVLAELERLRPGLEAFAPDLPGHGATPAGEHDAGSLAAWLHDHVTAKGWRAPVVVGHSAGGVVATLYAATYPTAAVVNVDQPLQLGPFTRLLHSLREPLRSPAFPSIWSNFEASFHIEHLPPAAQDLVRSTSTPAQELVLSYWAEPLDGDAAELEQRFEGVLATLAAARTAYTYLSGSTLAPEQRRWLTSRLPQIEIVEWPDSSHFPHLARPAEFAHLLRAVSSPS